MYQSDFLNQKVSIGDEVIFTEPRGRKLIRGTVIKLTPKGIKVKYRTDRETFIINGQFVIINEWQNAKETLPEEDGNYLTCDQFGVYRVFYYSKYHIAPFNILPDDIRYTPPTYWMKIPRGPGDE